MHDRDFLNKSSKKDERTIISCFACEQPGHKSPDCPNKAGSKLKDGDSKKKDSRKALHNNRISVSLEDANIVQAKVKGKELPLLLDTGAQISVMPDELIPSAARTGDEVSVKGFNGIAELRDIAVTKIKIGDKEFEEKVALAKLEELEGKGILALNPREKDSWDIMNMLSEREKRVCEVENQPMSFKDWFMF